MQMRASCLLISTGLVLGACADDRRDQEATAAASGLVDTIATEFMDAYYAQFPEEVYEIGYPSNAMDRFGDHSTASIAAWNARIDG